jgi:quercetin dioxygenase-like cupin family protein
MSRSCDLPLQLGSEKGGFVKPRNLFVALALAALAAAGLALSPQDDPLDPIRIAGDTHKVALENRFVRVLDVHLPPGKVEPRHRHPHGMSVYFTDWDAKVTPDGRPPEVHHRKAGTFAWNEAIVHSVENAGNTEGHILRIELKY